MIFMVGMLVWKTPQKGKREKSMMRSLVFLFVIAAIAATVADLLGIPFDTPGESFAKEIL